MASKRTVDILNQTASDTRTSPRKRMRLDEDHLPFNIDLNSTTKSLSDSVRRSPRKSVTKLQTPAIVRPTRSTEASNEITEHPDISPDVTKIKDDDLRKRGGKRKRNLAQKHKVDKSSPYMFKGQPLSNVKGVTLESYNSPAKEKKGRKASLGRTLKAHPIRLASQSTTQQAQHTTQQSERITLADNLPTTSASSAEQEDESDDVEDDDIDAVVDVAETDSRNKSDAQVNESEKRHSSSTLQRQASTQSKDQEQQKGKSSSALQSISSTKRSKKQLTNEEMQQKEEEKKRQKAAAQKKRKDDAIESAKAATDIMEERKKEFSQGIEVQAEEAGGLETWKIMGAGALTIEDVEDRRLKMATKRANSVWKLLEYLARVFRRLNDSGNYHLTDEEEAQHTIERLKRKCTLEYLRPESDKQQKDDHTVIELYQQVIPKLVHLLKSVLRGRYVDGLSREALEELLSLVEIGSELCKIVTEWTPKPSKLASGVRGAVHNYINPGLRLIRLWLADRKAFEDHRAVQQKVRANLALAQKNSRERKQRLWEERQQRLTSRYTHSTHSLHRSSNDSAEIVDIDELD